MINITLVLTRLFVAALFARWRSNRILISPTTQMYEDVLHQWSVHAILLCRDQLPPPKKVGRIFHGLGLPLSLVSV